MTASELLSSQREALETMLEMNAAARPGLSWTMRFILDEKDREARKHLLRMATEQRFGLIGGPYGTLGIFGENGYAPAIRDIVNSAERFRALGGRGEE